MTDESRKIDNALDMAAKKLHLTYSNIIIITLKLHYLKHISVLMTWLNKVKYPTTWGVWYVIVWDGFSSLDPQRKQKFSSGDRKFAYISEWRACLKLALMKQVCKEGILCTNYLLKPKNFVNIFSAKFPNCIQCF